MIWKIGCYTVLFDTLGWDHGVTQHATLSRSLCTIYYKRERGDQ